MANLADALIIGGGPAGLTAALTLGRQQQSSIVFDSGTYRNDPADFMHLIPGFDHVKPSEYRDKAKDNILSNYDHVQIQKTAVSSIQKDESNGGFILTDEAGKVWNGKKIILCNGVEDIFPGIDGYAECWGKGM
jgi:thioredoxin reductase